MSSGARRSRSVRALVAAGAAAVLGAVAACGGSTAGSVDGTPQPAESAPESTVAEPLADLLPDPAVFPAPYQAVVLPPQAAAQAAQDLGGVPDGASVDPAGCKPTPRAGGDDSLALIVGTDNGTRSTISVELTRVRDTLADDTALWTECPTITTTSRGVDTTVTTEVLPAPPIDADGTAAYRRTSESGSAAAQSASTTLTLLAQYGDVRVAATFMTFEGAAPDGAVLDQVFTEAAARVKSAG